METLNIGLLTALIAGILSFASPCVLPIVPGYLSFITGLGLEELTDHTKRSTIIRRAALNSIVFVFGFSIVFILLGASATTIGHFMRDHLSVLGRIAGVVIITLGVHMTGVIRIPFLLYEKRLQSFSHSYGILRSFTAGLVFAFGWTPCIGPILAGILAIAASQETARQGFLLLSVYSLGLGVPFILSGVFLNGFFTAFSKVKHHMRKIEVTGGVILILIGSIMLSGKLAVISQRLDFLNLEARVKSGTSSTETHYNQPEPVIAAADTTQPSNSYNDYGDHDFRLKTLDGKTVRLSDYQGKTVLVNIWAPWCGPCQMETPGFVKLYSKYHAQGFEIIGVAVDADETSIRDFIKVHKIEWAIGIGDDIARQYGTYGLPDNFLFGSDGKILKHFVGYTTEAALIPLIEQSLKQLQSNSHI